MFNNTRSFNGFVVATGRRLEGVRGRTGERKTEKESNVINLKDYRMNKTHVVFTINDEDEPKDMIFNINNISSIYEDEDGNMIMHYVEGEKVYNFGLMHSRMETIRRLGI